MTLVLNLEKLASHLTSKKCLSCHLGSAGVGVNLKTTCQEYIRKPCCINMLGVNDLHVLLCSFHSVKIL